MSKPVTNVEIEDVLSSIRRLVSSSDRVERVEHAETDDVSDKLVLTPSLRVDEVSETGAEDAETVEDQGIAEETSGEALSEEALPETSGDDTASQSEMDSDEEFLEFVAKSATPEDDSDDVEAAELSDKSETEDSDADLVFEQLGEILSENEENSTDNSTEPDVAEADAGDADDDAVLVLRGTSEDTANDDDTAENLRRRAAEFEEIVAEKDDQWDPDGTTQDDNAAVSGGPVPWQDQDDDELNDSDEEMLPDPLAVFDRPREISEKTENDVEPDEAAQSEVEDTLAEADAADEVEEPETAADAEEADLSKVLADVALQDDTPETATVTSEEATEEPEGEEAEATFTFRAHERAEASSVVPPLSAVAEPSEAEGTDKETPLAIEEALLDEEALRDMVSDIVRQELQGALGERITRNVRKLVRREIHRALASQQLE